MKENKITDLEQQLIEYQNESISPLKHLALDSKTPAFGSVEKLPDT